MLVGGDEWAALLCSRLRLLQIMYPGSMRGNVAIPKTTTKAIPAPFAVFLAALAILTLLWGVVLLRAAMAGDVGAAGAGSVMASAAKFGCALGSDTEPEEMDTLGGGVDGVQLESSTTGDKGAGGF